MEAGVGLDDSYGSLLIWVFYDFYDSMISFDTRLLDATSRLLGTKCSI